MAVLGSILAQSYHQTLSPDARQPSGHRAGRGRRVDPATQAVAAQLGSAGRFLLGPANDAFVSAMHVTTIVAAVIALAGAIVVLRWMPGLERRPGGGPGESSPAAPEQAAPERAMPQLAALEAAAAPRIAPVDAVDVWQENLSAGAGQRQSAGAGQRQPAGAGQLARRAEPVPRPRWTPRMSTSSICGQGTSPTSHTAWKDKKR